MICPHCSIGVNIEWDETVIPKYDEEDICNDGYCLKYGFCPVCTKFILLIAEGEDFYVMGGEESFNNVSDYKMVFPTYCSTRKLTEAVPKQYSTIFIEADQVKQISPRASATLSRYLLQRILHEELNIKKPNLELEIQAFSEMHNIPSKLGSMLQIMRKVANFAAHPKKSTHSNEIVDVNKGEAEIMLDLIYEVFDYVFIKPKQQDEFLANVKEKYGIEIE